MALIRDFRAELDPVAVFEAAYKARPYPWQLEYLRETRPMVVLKGRQIGASYAGGALAIRQAIYRPGSVSIIISKSLKHSTWLAARSRDGLNALGIRLIENTASRLRLANGSYIISLPGTPGSVRGFSADLLILDEAAYILPATIVAAKPLIAATGGRLIVQSTPSAESGYFWETVKRKDPSWAHLNVPSSIVLDPKFLAEERASMTADEYATEYECQFGRAGATLFSAARIARLMLPDEE